MLRTVQAVRYVLPFREGSSVPALVEADDLGLYVVKLRGAAQGPKALIAELLAGELGRALGLKVPEVVLVDLDRRLADSEPDPELANPLEASAGLNLGLDFLPGSITFDPVAGPPPDRVTASRVVMFDAFVANIDRTPRNPNLLAWHDQLWLIDHGAALYFHHGWAPQSRLDESRDRFREVRQHVLLPWASALAEAAGTLGDSLNSELIDSIVGQIPDGWLLADRRFSGPDSVRSAYKEWFQERANALPVLLEEAELARAERV